MIHPFDWPALALGQQTPLTHIRFERGVWGKAHAARTDYRWLALSADFEKRPGRALEAELLLGSEDRPTRTVLWRSLLKDRCYAVVCYPSQAVDAAGRQDFLEKQIFEWRRPAEVPAALGALLLLPRVNGLTDEIWWEQRMALADPESVLPIKPADHEPISCDEQSLGAVIERGLTFLRQAVDEKALERLYLDLLAKKRPAGLVGVREPLPPEALAALLLPLPRPLADQISLAGWIPSSRSLLTDLAERWDVLVLPAETNLPSETSADETLRFQAWKMAQQIHTTDPSLLPELFAAEAAPTVITVPPRHPEKEESPPLSFPKAVRPDLQRPGCKLDLQPPPQGQGSEILRNLYEFARDPDRRWLNPDDMRQRWGGDVRPLNTETARDLFVSWVQGTHDQKPPYAHEEQWKVKVDLLRSAALVLCPDPLTFRRVGVPTSRHIPALFFGLVLHGNRRDELGKLGEKALRDMLEQSLSCQASQWTRGVHSWLALWRTQTRVRQPNIEALIGDTLKAHPADFGRP